MPSVTPNRTNHLRQNATFRGTRANPYATPAIEKSNRTKKRKLINRARAALRDPDLQAAAETLVSVKRRWAKVGSAGAEHDKKLTREFEGIYEAFRGRYEGVRARAIARNAKAGNAKSTGGENAENGHTEKPYAQLGTGQSGGIEQGGEPPRIGTEKARGTSSNTAPPAPPASHPTKGSNE